jgi:hypothetical protein
LFSLAQGGCGDGGRVSVHFNSGTVSETARCSGNRGEFPLRRPNGLSVIIIVTDQTTIVRADFTKTGRATWPGPLRDGRLARAVGDSKNRRIVNDN